MRHTPASKRTRVAIPTAVREAIRAMRTTMSEAAVCAALRVGIDTYRALVSPEGVVTKATLERVQAAVKR